MLRRQSLETCYIKYIQISHLENYTDFIRRIISFNSILNILSASLSKTIFLFQHINSFNIEWLISHIYFNFQFKISLLVLFTCIGGINSL